MSKFPYLPLCVDAYRNDTAHLSNEEHGAYLRLLMYAWRTEACRLPDDDVKLARMLGVTAKKWFALKPTIMAFWTLADGFWVQGRLAKEHEWVAQKSEQKRAAGSKGGDAKSRKTKDQGVADATANATANALPPNTLHLTQGLQEESRVEPTEPLPEKTEPDTRIAASRSMPGTSRYFFESGVIRLTEPDFKKMEATFPNVSLRAELTGLTGWAADQPNWFFAVQGALAKRNRDSILARDRVRFEAEAKALAPKVKPSCYVP